MTDLLDQSGAEGYQRSDNHGGGSVHQRPVKSRGKQSSGVTSSEAKHSNDGKTDERQGTGSKDDSTRLSVYLMDAIERRIIPELLRSRVEDGMRGGAGHSSPPSISKKEIDRLAELSIAHDGRAAFDFVDSFRARGVGLKTLCMDLLAPAARELGRHWCNDTCNFLDVTCGVSRLQSILHELGSAVTADRSHEATPGRVLLLPVPGEQHTFGVQMVAEFFRRDGWDVSCVNFTHGRSVSATVGTRWFDVVGLSLASETLIDSCAAEISAIRKASINQNIQVMVGGALASQRQDIHSLVSADVIATSFSGAAAEVSHADISSAKGH